MRYVVFVTPGPVDGAYVLAGPGPTSRILPDGTLSAGAGLPFTKPHHGRWDLDDVTTLDESDVVRFLVCRHRRVESAIFDFAVEDIPVYGHPTGEAATDEFMSEANSNWHLRPDWHDLTLGTVLGTDRSLNSYFVNEAGDTYLIVRADNFDSYWHVSGYEGCVPD